MTLHRGLLRLVLGLAFIAGWIAVFGPATFRFATPVVQTLNPAEIASNGPNSYYVVLKQSASSPLLEIGGDSPKQPWGSALDVIENGIKLGPAHTMHGSIASIGKGRYSHWDSGEESTIIFSTSDNTDPRSNGRTYMVVAQPQVSMLLFVLVVLPLSALILQWLLSPWIGYLTVALAATAAVAWLWLLSGHLALSPDSTTYTGWLALVPLGYPLFLSGIKAIFGTFTAASAVQISLTIGACLFLALAVARATGHRAAGFAALFVLLCYLPMLAIAGQLLSEALFVPLILVNVGAAIFLIAEPKIRYAMLLALTSALIMFVRPAGYFVPLGALFLTIAMASRFRWMLKWAVAPMIVLTAATLLINVAVRGNASPSMVGRNLFPHVAFLFEPGLVTGDRDFAIAIDEALKPHRTIYEKATSRIERYMYSMNDYNSRLSAMDRTVYAKLAAERKSASQAADADADYRRLERIYIRFFLDTIYQKPIGYLSLVRDQILGGWQLGVLLDWGPFAQTYITEANSKYQDNVNVIKNRKMPIGEEALLPNTAALESFPGQFIEFFEVQYKRLRAQRRIIYAIGAITLLAIPIAVLFGRRSRHWLALGYCGVIIHGSVLLTTAVTVFIPRYALPIDPLILIAGVIIADMLLLWAAKAIRILAGLRRPVGAPAGSHP
ncbi:MAG: Pectate lyase [Bradyrhizobium sp.]|nr:Pectate lyase [Bradyrhizobium sp.]